MHAETIREFALSLGEVEEGFPFGPDTLVMKTNSKMFLLISLDAIPLSISVKGPPGHNMEIREMYPGAVLPGYHLNKQHWNTLILTNELRFNFVLEQISISFDLLSKKTGTKIPKS